MNSRRQEKFARLIQRELGNYFLRDGKKIFGSLIISVTHVIVSPDIGYAKIYVTFLNENDKNKALGLVKAYTREIRMALSSRIRNEVRKIPEIAFFYDDTLDYMEKIDEVFKKLNMEHPEKAKEDDSEEKNN
jgi:ribosome-binding factor A